MAAAAQNTNNSTIRSILLAEKLTGSNFTNWHRNLRIVLRYEKKLKFVEQPMAPAPDPETADPDTIDKYYELVNIEQEIACLIMSIKAFHACKQEDGQSISPYLLKMKSYLDTLEQLGYVMPNELGIPKKAETLVVLAIREGRIQKDNKKLQGTKGKDKGKNKLAYAAKLKIHHCQREIIRQRTLSATTAS
ncbi:hypothetical protein Tco_0061979, partial [Tanacetum coccineum]